MEKGLYIVATEPLVGYEKFTEFCVKYEVPMLQLRDKKMNDRELLRTARQMKQITKGSRTKLVINDRTDIAFLSDADYLHIGLSDIRIEDARKLLGQKIKIGVSAETYDEAIFLNQIPDVDYIGLGPIFETASKVIPNYVPMGVDGLRKVVCDVEKPVVAIGGIFPSNLSDIKAVGADGWAMIRHFVSVANEKEFAERIAECNGII